MIPQGRFVQAAVGDLLDYLIEESTLAQNERRAPQELWGGACLEDKWLDWQAGYMAEPAMEVKDFPFMGASNLVMPIIATDVDTMFARLFGLLLDPTNMWTIEAMNPEMEQLAPRIQEFLRWAQKTELDLEQPLGNWLLEVLKLGTGILKQRYNREMKKVYEWRELAQGVFQQQLLTLLKDAPAIHHTRLFDFWVPSGYNNITDAPWCGEDIRMTWSRFMKRVQAGVYQGTERLGQWSAQERGSNISQQMDRLSGYSPSRGDKIELREFWLDFDIDRDGWDEALVCTVHIPSRTYVRLDFNPFFNQDKPYSVARFMRNENSFYGIGLGQMLEPFQEESTAMHNQRIDNGTVQNSQMFAVNKNNKNISATEPVYPAKIWLVDNAEKDVRALQLGNSAGTSAASIQNEQFSLSYGQRRTGVNDYTYGQPDASIGYSTAYTTQQMMANSTRRQGEVLREVRGALSESGTRVLELYQQFNQRGKEFFALGAQDGQLVRMVLQFPMDLIRRGLRVNVTAIDVALSKDSMIRQHTIVLQQVMQYYQSTIQMGMMAANPQMPEPIRQLAMQAVTGSSVLMRRLLDTYGEQDLDKIVPDLAGGQNAITQQFAQIQQLIALAGGSGSPGLPAGTAGMAGAAGPGVGGVPPTAGAVTPGNRVAGYLPAAGASGGY